MPRNDNQNLRIGLDVDGVLADFTTPYLQELNRIQGSNIQLDLKTQPTEWDWETNVGFTKETRETFWRTAGQAELFWADMPTLDGLGLTGKDIVALQRWCFSNTDDVFFVSKCPLHCRKARAEWLYEQFAVDNPLIHTNRKGHVAYGLHLHGFIDDKPANLIDIRRFCGTDCRTLLLDQPWNRGFSDPYIERVHSLSEGLDKLTEMVVS